MFSTTLKKQAAVVAALFIGAVGSAQAVPFNWSDTVADYTLVSRGNSYSYTHDITDGYFGYRPGIDSLFYASLSITLGDDALGGDLPWFLLGDEEETAGFRFDNGAWQVVSDPTVDALSTFDFLVTSLLSTDGLLDVTIKANSGDFRFGLSHLTAWGDRAVGGSTSVPEPATLSLFGLALLGVGAAARRRKS